MIQSRAQAMSAIVLMAAFLIAGCGSSASTPTESLAAPASAAAAPSPSPVASTAPASSASSGSPADPFAGQPYTLALPQGYVAYDFSNPAGKAALGAAASANPGLAPMIQMFEANPIYRLAVNQLTGGVIVTVGMPSQGMSLDALGQSFTAQFQAVPGVATVPTPEPTALPAGNALHWTIAITANKVGGGTYSVTESVYLVTNAQTAVVVEFVTLAGGVPPDEGAVLQSLAFR